LRKLLERWPRKIAFLSGRQKVGLPVVGVPPVYSLQFWLIIERIDMAQPQPGHHSDVVGHSQQSLHVTGVKDAAPKWSVFEILKFGQMVIAKGV
jgi:hypothetical protein